jgi:hypothetical protein
MRLRYYASAVLLAALGVACDNTNSPTGMGTMRVMLQDTPFSDSRAVLVTFSEVSAHRTGAAFVTLPFADGASSRTCDLKKLQGAQDVLGTGPMAQGHYTQLRLTVSATTLYFYNPSVGAACAATIAAPAGASAPATVSSGTVILNREFDLEEDDVTTILLDFDGDGSIIQTGQGSYRMTPVIAVVSVG